MDREDVIQTQGNQIAPKFQGNINFQQVRFSYNPEAEVLKGINLSIEPGQTVAIVGSSGAGKSTMINLLSRFYEIDSGKITIDNIDINEFTLQSLRRQIAVVLQDVFLFKIGRASCRERVKI